MSKPILSGLVEQKLESTGAIGWFRAQYPNVAAVCHLRVYACGSARYSSNQYYRLNVREADINIYFYDDGAYLRLYTRGDNFAYMALDIGWEITDMTLRALDKLEEHARVYIATVIIPREVCERLPQPIAEEIVPELALVEHKLSNPNREWAYDILDWDPDEEYWDNGNWCDLCWMAGHDCGNSPARKYLYLEDERDDVPAKYRDRPIVDWRIDITESAAEATLRALRRWRRDHI